MVHNELPSRAKRTAKRLNIPYDGKGIGCIELTQEKDRADQRAKDKQVGGDHYKDMPIQPFEYIQKNGIPWLEGNAIKYISRHSVKGGKDDLLKAIHYLELAIEEYYT